jgi:hypothetical protein
MPTNENCETQGYVHVMATPQSALAQLAIVTAKYFRAQALAVESTHDGYCVRGPCTVPTHRDPAKHAVATTNRVPHRRRDIFGPAYVWCEESGCPGPERYLREQRDAERRRQWEAEQAQRIAVWTTEHQRPSCSVTVSLMPDDTARVVVWTPIRRGTRYRLGTFTNAHLQDRDDRAAILANLPPSIRADARKAFGAVLPDYQWARSQQRRSA